MQIERLARHRDRTDATYADLALMGFELGKQCAQRLTRGYAVTPLQHDPSPLPVIVHFADLVEGFIAHQRKTNGLTDGGEAAYRAGFNKGLEAQLANPNADVVLKIRSAAQ